MTTVSGDVRVDLRRSYEQLTLSQKRIAELIVEDPEFVAFATVDKLGARLGVSPSTVVRFAYRLGLSGYPELQGRVREIVRAQLRPGLRAGEAGVETEALTSHLADSICGVSLQHDVENLRATIARLSRQDLDTATSMLVSARRIYVAGGFTSGTLAHYVSLMLGRIRGGSSVLDGGAHSAAHILDICDQDAVIVATFPPYAQRTLQMVRAAKDRGAAIVAITDTLVAPVTQAADVVLATHVSGIGRQNSLVAAMAVVNALLNAIAALTPESEDRYADLFRLMNDWDFFLLRGDDE